MGPSSSQRLRVIAAILLATAAVAYVVTTTLSRRTAGELGFFYDVSAARIFTGPRDAPPPIRGVDGSAEDAFRAVVVSATGKPSDRSSWKVAYLERFSPELKEKMLAAQRAGEALAMGRMEMQNHRFVRRVDDREWQAMSSPEAEAILSEWTRLGSNGATPVLCTP